MSDLICSKEGCVPGEGCAEGESDLSKCKFFNTTKSTEEQSFEENGRSSFLPWHGSTMGIGDTEVLTSCSRTFVIGVIGAGGSGKTTYLATLYCLIRNGLFPGKFRFAGSRTIMGWETIAWYLTWKPHNQVQFPPHTTSFSGRIPGLLHLAFQNEEKQIINLLFTDAPGEWFDDWTENSSAMNARGAVWIDKFSDAVLLFADRGAFGVIEERGEARNSFNQLVSRVENTIANRPLGLIWSKSDVEVDKDFIKPIEERVQSLRVAQGKLKEFKISVQNRKPDWHEEISGTLNWLLNNLDRTSEVPVNVSSATNDPFLNLRHGGK